MCWPDCSPERAGITELVISDDILDGMAGDPITAKMGFLQRTMPGAAGRDPPTITGAGHILPGDTRERLADMGRRVRWRRGALVRNHGLVSSKIATVRCGGEFGRIRPGHQADVHIELHAVRHLDRERGHHGPS
jgi:hypothetical protein